MSKKVTEIVIGEQVYQVPRMNLEQVEEFLDLNAKLAETPLLKDQLPILVDQVKVALSRNNPEVTVEELKRVLDLEDLYGLVEKLGEAAGLKRPSGDASPDPSIGDLSTGTSHPASE